MCICMREAVVPWTWKQLLAKYINASYSYEVYFIPEALSDVEEDENGVPLSVLPLLEASLLHQWSPVTVSPGECQLLRTDFKAVRLHS